jgi:NTP pyrophosphatase (non-canonical NTP hydrolase)
MEDEFCLGKIDYDIYDGLYEWKDERHKFTPDFYRLKIFTERMQEFLEEKTGKKVPLLSTIKLTKEELNEVRRLIKEEARFIGLYGAYSVKVKDILNPTLWGDCLATEEELHYDYKWNEL